MRMIDIIIKKRDGHSLTREELAFFIDGVSHQTIPDYQVSSLLMAIKFVGMDKNETSTLTELMMHSGDVIDLSAIKGIKADKHSTGGVGDKTSLALGPMVAACGVKVAKMSGRGLGHTGGTLDKLEAIPGVSISLSTDKFITQVNDIGLAIIGQTGKLVPADKKLYALRDVTGTVESLPLIASSIMSKKLASGSDTILLDVKFGKGAFMKNLEDAKALAKVMVEIGKTLDKDTRAVLTDMDQPLGLAVGNNLEVIEAVNTLKGHGPKDFVELCLQSGSIMLIQAKVETDLAKARKRLQKTIDDGSALKKLKEMVTAQGGDASYIENTAKFSVSRHVVPILSAKKGYVRTIDALAIGEAAMKLGAGREKQDDVIDYSAGIVLNKKIGYHVDKGEVLATAYTDKEDYRNVLQEISAAFDIVGEIVPEPKIFHDLIQ